MTTDTTKASLLAHDQQRQVVYARDRLVQQAAVVRDAAQRIIDGLDKYGEDYSINELGELQSRGFELDRLCSVYRSTIAQRDAVKYALALDES